MKKVGIIGATGFTGSELVRLLFAHPNADILYITSESHQGKRFSDVHPHFSGIVDMKLVSSNAIDLEEADIIFLALPHGISMNYVQKLYDSGKIIIDLSGDYRLDGPETYEKWYNKKHIFPDAFKTSVYGIPELFRKEIQQTKFIANPGCYPSSAILGLSPLIENDLVYTDSIIIDSKSGVTGAGIKSKPGNLYSAAHDNFNAYGVINHRHTIEIQLGLSRFTDNEVQVQFTPHLLPVDRGILSSMYLKYKKLIERDVLVGLYKEFYADSKFIRIREKLPGIKHVRGTNFCDLYVDIDNRTGNILVFSAIDNLVRGAAGQAIQNMNIICGWEDSTGLINVPLYP